jgi:hypothetical protein
MVYKDKALQKRFFLALKKVITPKPQPQIISTRMQTRSVQPGKSNVPVIKTENKQPIIGQNNQATQQ